MIGLVAQNAQVLPAITSRPLRPFFEKVIDKKVNQVAVNILARIFNSLVNYLCTTFYAAYRERLQYCLNEKKLSTELNAQDLSIAISIIGGACLYDCTAAKRVTVDQAANLIMIEDQNFMNGKSIRFCTDTGLEDISFGVARKTQAIVITDILNRPGWIRIKEQQTNGNENVWRVDTNQLLSAEVMRGRAILGFDEYYIAQEEFSLIEEIESL